jgi:hypothetical protein
MKLAALPKSKPAVKPHAKAAAKPAATPRRYVNGLPVVEISDPQTEAVIAKIMKRNQLLKNAK